jgi:serine protease AprX
VHLLGLRVPGGRLDQENPNAVVGTRFFRGSGTSQAAAVESGLAALYLSKNPTATADAVKKALTSTVNVPNVVKAQGFNVGVTDVNKSLGVRPTTVQTATGATGTGSLEAARGSVHVADGSSVLTGEQDIFGKAWDGTSWAAATTAGRAWDGGTWNGSQWTGTGWTGDTWNGAAWSGSAWSGSAWSGTAWSGAAWSGNAWSGTGWSGSAWSGSAWSGSSWSGTAWSGSAWSGAGWSAQGWE